MNQMRYRECNNFPLFHGMIQERMGLSRIISSVVLSFFAAILFATNVYAEQKSDFNITFLDVGQGDCAIVSCDGKYMIIDGGPSKASDIVYTYLKKNSIDYIDVMVATHPDEDHIGGLSGALNYAKIGECYCPVDSYDTKTFKSLVKYLGKQDRGIIIPQVPTELELGSATVSFIGPLRKEADSNNNSIVTRITYGENTFLFMGDAEYTEELNIMQNGMDVSCDVLKIGHHGSNSSTTRALLNRAEPKYSIISVGADNYFAHPSGAVLGRLMDAQTFVYRTDLQGDIFVNSDGNTITVTTEKTAEKEDILRAGMREVQQESEIQQESEVQQESEIQKQIETGETQSYVLNTNSHKFHIPSCSSVSDMKPKNRKDVNMSREEIIDDGYEPCKRCNP